ncbi:AIR carboxylase family protein [Candidatus Uhrbacteria bacterium]|nr:AIR carboxylase family protein [Candidatus Uhrbacteria bacterium]
MTRRDTMLDSLRVIAEGKTKRIYEDPGNQNLVIIESKDDITAGDGARHDVIEGKGALATATTCNVFKFLKDCGAPLAYHSRIDATRFKSAKCAMIPLEVVARRVATGSYCKRNPCVSKGMLLPKLVIEFFLKTSKNQWRGTDIPCDDPFMQPYGDSKRVFNLFVPSEPIASQVQFGSVTAKELFKEMNKECEAPEGILEEIKYITRIVFYLLEKAFQLRDFVLHDLKLEFGIDSEGRLLLADVVDNDSWRLTRNGTEYSKQAYRDGEQLNVVKRLYEVVTEHTGKFEIPYQQLIFWTGSSSDDITPFKDAFIKYLPEPRQDVAICRSIATREIICSVHKAVQKAIPDVQQAVHDIPDTVIIAYIGRSNGAGPVLSAHVSVPVISVPATWKEHWGDVDSSLRMPSDVPTSTILEPSNAVLHALEILALRNPYVYAHLRSRLEERLVNQIVLPE